MASTQSQSSNNGHGMSSKRRIRSSTACTSCRQMKMKCDRREKLPSRCTRCEAIDSRCEISTTFKRQRMKGFDSDETRRLRQELEHLKSQVASLLPRASPSIPPHISPSAASAATWVSTSPVNNHVTLQRSVGDVIVAPWQIDTAFNAFFQEMHPLLPFVTECSPNECYDKETFLFWTICTLGLRSVAPELSHALANYVATESLHAPHRSSHNQVAATAVVQALLLLSFWPFKSPSLLHEAVWLHCGAATHLALHIGLHQPYSASEFVPKEKRAHIPGLVTEFRRTWIACYVVNVIVSFARGYPSTVRADFNVIEYTRSSPAQLSISPDLFKFLLISRTLEECQELGSPPTVPHGLIDPGCRAGIYRLIQSRLSEIDRMILPLSPYMSLFLTAAKLMPVIQVLQSTSPISLQEMAVLAGFDYASQLINDARVVRSTINTVHLPVFLDGLVLTAAVLIFKIHISRFSSLVDAQLAQHQISEACAYYRDGINDFGTIPARLTIFMDGLRKMVSENHLRTGGFVIENAKCHYTQNILYEVLWDFYEWRQQSVGAAEFQQIQPSSHGPVEDNGLGNMLSFLDTELLDSDFWQMLAHEGGAGL